MSRTGAPTLAGWRVTSAGRRGQKSSDGVQPWRVGLLLLAIGLLAGAAALDPVHEAVGRVLDICKQVIGRHPALGLALFMLFSALSAVAFFFSSAVLVPVATYAWGKPATVFLLWGSWLIGAMISYLIGRRPGRRLVRWLLPARRMARYEKAITAKSNFGLVLLFQLAVPSEVPGYLLGAARYPFGKYLLARSVAEVPFAVGAVLLADSFVSGKYGLLLAIAIVCVLLSATALYLLHRRAFHGTGTRSR
jgi:uncharacterized membrane protein YdjX (TVP38/TMEM64 family)